jgi:uncharacterized repeat protein (TIGR03803 family)
MITPVLTQGLLYYSSNYNARTLWAFSGSSGSNPVIAPIEVEGVLYGVTTEAGFFNTGSGRSYGILYSLDTNGTNFQVLHTFFGAGPPYLDGDNNCGDPGLFSGYLISTGSLIIGTTYAGGPSTDFAHHAETSDCGGGTIFFYNTSNSSYSVVSPFVSSSLYGAQPTSIAIYNNRIYGVCVINGGGWENFNASYGTIWSTDLTGNNPNVEYAFISSSFYDPRGFVQSGSSNMVYGTWVGGNGGVFAFDMNDDSFDPLYSFTGGNDGYFPYLPPVISASVLFGVATYGGSLNNGTIYSMNTDGTGFSVVYSFGSTDAYNPISNIYITDNTIYGLASGGAFNNGAIYSVNTNGTNFQILYNFTGSNDGIPSYTIFDVYENTMYFTPEAGGEYGQGTVFSYYIG